MGPQGRDPMFPVRNPTLGANPVNIDPGFNRLGQQFQPVGAGQTGMMPAQAQGSPYGVPFVPLGDPRNPASQPPAAPLARALMGRPWREGLVGGGGGTGRDRNSSFGRDRAGSQFSGRDRSNFGH